MANIVKIAPELVADFWPLIERDVTRAIAFHEFMDATDVRTLLERGDGQLFIVAGGNRLLGFAIMEVIHYPRRRVANVFLSGGAHGFLGVAVNELLPRLKQWAAEKHTDAFAIMGARPGWMRALRGTNFRSMAHNTIWWDSDVEGRRQQHANSDEHGRAVEGSSAVHH